MLIAVCHTSQLRASSNAESSLESAGFAVDYVALADAETLADPADGRPRRLLAAARLGTTRLIDNIAVEARTGTDEHG